jgi:hypothetical protein
LLMVGPGGGVGAGPAGGLVGFVGDTVYLCLGSLTPPPSPLSTFAIPQAIAA